MLFFLFWGSSGINDDSSGVGFGVGVGVVGGGGLSNSVGDGCGWCCWVGLAVGNTASAAPVSLSEILD